jgi:hypothetical protein
MEHVYRLIHYGGRHSGGGRGTAEAPRSMITRYWKIIFREFYEKIEGLK